MIYLDNAATSVVDEAILNTYVELNKLYYGNAASNHRYGIESAKLIQASRHQIHKMLGLDDTFEVLFNSGATEANNTAIKGVAFRYQKRGKHLITTKVEHPSVLEAFRQLESDFGFLVTYLDVDEEGKINPESLRLAMRSDTILVSIMAVNNEVGTINDIAALSAIVHQYPKAFFHCDTTQAIGKLHMPFNACDMFVLSAHKINGLKGSGALIKKKNINLLPLLSGGGQEGGYRSGTNNVPSEVVLGKTIRHAMETQAKHWAHAKMLNDYLRQELANITEIVINSPQAGSPFILNFSLLKHKASVVVEALSAQDIMVSTISACSSKRNEISHVLRAMNKDSVVASNPIRLSFNHLNTLDEINVFISTLKDILRDIKTL